MITITAVNIERVVVRPGSTTVVQSAPRSAALRVVQSASPGPGGQGQGSGGLTWSAPSAQTVWMVPHNLGRFPIVAIRDSTGEEVLADVQHLDVNVLMVTFSQPVLGSVDLR